MLCNCCIFKKLQQKQSKFLTPASAAGNIQLIRMSISDLPQEKEKKKKKYAY